MSDPILLLVWILVFAIISYIVFWTLNQLALPQPLRVVIIVAVVLIFLVLLLRQLGGIL